MLGQPSSNQDRQDATLLWHLFSGQNLALDDRDVLQATGDVQMGQEAIPKARVQLWFLLAGLVVSGAAAIIGSIWIPWQWLAEITKQFGSALLVAGLLGLTVDRALKIELIRNVFYAAFRYLLPTEIKDEVARVIGYKFLCTDHHTVIEIEPIDDELVRVHIRIQRTLKNVSYQSEEVRNQFAVDEWGFTGHASQIQRCSMEFAGETLEGEDNDDYAEKPDAIGKITAKRTVKRGETVKLITIGSEVCRNNVQLFMSFRAPTVRPVIDVVIPKGFDHVCNFGVPEGKTRVSSITKKYELDGTQFPGQHMRIRWWRTANASEPSSVELPS